MIDREQACAAQHFGLWCVQGRWMSDAVAAYNQGSLAREPVRGANEAERRRYVAGKLPKAVYYGYDAVGDPKLLYTVDESGIALLPLSGQFTKGESSFGGVSNVRTKLALRRADEDPDVKGIMMLIDSPGGTVAGQKAMGDEAMRIRKNGRTMLAAHAEDLMASAAMWLGAQAERLTASAMTEVGSIGTVAVVHDTSKMAEAAGVTVHVLSTGDMKGAFTPGTEVTDHQLEMMQGRMDELNQFFLGAIKRGRGMSMDQVRELATGWDWLAAEAKSKGLIDDVMSQDDAIASFRARIRQRGRESERAAHRRAQRVRLAELS